MNKDVIIYVPKGEGISWSTDEDRIYAIQFLNKSGFSIVNNIFQATHIYSVYLDSLLRKSFFWLLIKNIFRKKLFAVVTNDLSFDQNKIRQLFHLLDLAVVPSTKMFNLLKSRGINVQLLPFFVDPAVFKPLPESKDDIYRKLHINSKKLEGKLIIASFQRDSLGDDLSKPKWQKNPDLLINIVKNLDPAKVLLLFAGPRRHYIVEHCLKYNIDFLYFGDFSYVDKGQDDMFINNHPSEVINMLYNIADLYIVTSRSEGGPKAILECALSKRLIFSTRVGLSADVLHPDLFFEEGEIGSLIKKIKRYEQSPGEFVKYINYNYYNASQLLSEDNITRIYREMFV